MCQYVNSQIILFNRMYEIQQVKKSTSYRRQLKETIQYCKGEHTISVSKANNGTWGVILFNANDIVKYIDTHNRYV